MVGICGMGGLGKTTLAEIVFKQSRHQYDTHCFFPNVREQYQSHGSHNLKVQFFRELSNEKDLQYGGLDSLKKSLGHKKLLIVLDDVDDLDQYNCLLEHSHSWLNFESKLIITSRNQQVLRNIIGNDKGMIYNLKGLKKKIALELFCLHAFKRKSPEESEKELSLKFVNYAQGLPLALKVLGSHLFSKSKDVWQSLLNKITKVDADEKVTRTLKISFDGLSSKQQSIFLDIACVFRGREKYLVRDILDDCGDFNIAIEVLIDRCLVTVSDEGTLEMHDLLAEMGRSIARGSNNKFLENCSTRLCMGKDVCRFFSSNKASSTIEAISYDHHDGDVINLDPSFFKKLPSLRLLNISSFIGFRSPYALRDPFPGELRFLEWNGYPLESLGSNFTPQNIVYLSMQGSDLRELWEENQDVSNLKYVILSESKKLTCLPNLSQGNLHRLRLDGCTSLVTLPPLRFHDILDDPDKEFEVMHIYNSLTVKYNDSVTEFLLCELLNPKISDWVVRKLSTKLLDLNGCSNLTTLSEISGNVKFIRLSETAIKELHPSIFSLKNLLVLDLHNCKHLRELPNSICELESLEHLDLAGCVSFDKFPRLPKSIKVLHLSGTLIQKVEYSLFDCLPSVNVLYMQACKKLESLPATICKLKSLQVLNLKDCSQLKSFPEILEPMEKLEVLWLNGTGIEVLPSSIENLVVLKELNLSECKNLKSIPTTICKLKFLRELYLGGCSQLKSFPEISEPMEKLEKLYLNRSGIEVLPSSIENLVMLNNLNLSECKNLKSIPITICKLKFLRKLYLEGCSQLKSFPEISEPMEKLEVLLLNGTGIEVLPSSIENLVMLESLPLSGCENLKSIPITICKLKFLRELYLGGCSQLKSFPEISEPMEKLEKLYLNRSGIEVLPSSIENLVMLYNLNLSKCKNLKSIPTTIFNMRNIDSIELDEYPQLQILPYNGLPVEDSSETSTSQLLVTHDQPYICSSCTSTAILNLHYDGVDFTCCQCFLFYTIRNILAAQYFMDEIFIGKCRDERGKNLIEALRPFIYSGDSINQSIESILPYLNLPVTFLEDYDKYRDEKEKDLSRPSFCYRGDTITQWFAHQSMGSSLQLNLPFSSSKDLRKYFLGFALCIVVEFEATTLKRDDVLTCEYNLKTKTGQNFQFYSIMQCQKATHFDDDDDDSNLDSSSNHQVFVWYLYRKDISMKMCDGYLSFLLEKEESGIFEFEISKGTIKQCGVHLLYRQNIQLQDN